MSIQFSDSDPTVIHYTNSHLHTVPNKWNSLPSGSNRSCKDLDRLLLNTCWYCTIPQFFIHTTNVSVPLAAISHELNSHDSNNPKHWFWDRITKKIDVSYSCKFHTMSHNIIVQGSHEARSRLAQYHKALYGIFMKFARISYDVVLYHTSLIWHHTKCNAWLLLGV